MLLVEKLNFPEPSELSTGPSIQPRVFRLAELLCREELKGEESRWAPWCLWRFWRWDFTDRFLMAKRSKPF